ncbi:hypothetical protein [Sulfitobacter sp. 1A15299]|uniref:hypothetical protein n=1 Tax=Sulfitobacter sp. 1A15299 TaxID=3368598 RepID=UPI003745BC03
MRKTAKMPFDLTRHFLSGFAMLAALGTAALPAREAAAAAWPRGEDKSFVTLSYETTVDGPDFGDFGAFYYEYGVTEKLTFGLDIGKSQSAGQVSAIAFLRYPLELSGGDNVFAAEVGLGWAERDGSAVAALRPGLSWGRPVSGAWGSGWLGVESTFAIYEDGETLGKIDSSFGINYKNGSLSIFKLEFAAPSDGDETLAFAPAHVIKVSENSFLELGLSHEFTDAVTKVKVGVWHSF